MNQQTEIHRTILRKAREAAALKANMKRRKEQAKADNKKQKSETEK
jgi:hypothetical protein